MCAPFDCSLQPFTLLCRTHTHIHDTSSRLLFPLSYVSCVCVCVCFVCVHFRCDLSSEDLAQVFRGITEHSNYIRRRATNFTRWTVQVSVCLSPVRVHHPYTYTYLDINGLGYANKIAIFQNVEIEWRIDANGFVRRIHPILYMKYDNNKRLFCHQSSCACTLCVMRASE